MIPAGFRCTAKLGRSLRHEFGNPAVKGFLRNSPATHGKVGNAKPGMCPDHQAELLTAVDFYPLIYPLIYFAIHSAIYSTIDEPGKDIVPLDDTLKNAPPSSAHKSVCQEGDAGLREDQLLLTDSISSPPTFS
jgi:hypothetical protein